MEQNSRDIKRATAEATEPEILDSASNAADNNVDIVAHGNELRNKERADKVDSVVEIGNNISDKVLKKIESKDYLYDNLRRKERDEVSRETFDDEVKNREKKVIDFKVLVIVAALALLFLKILKKRKRKAVNNAKNTAFDSTGVFSSGGTGEQKAGVFESGAGEYDSLADAILIRREQQSE